MNILWHTFKCANGPGNKFHPQIILTEMLFSQAHLPGKSFLVISILFAFTSVEITWTPVALSLSFWCFHIFPKD